MTLDVFAAMLPYIEEQLARIRKATLTLTAVAAGLAVIFLGLFLAFGRPDVGFVLVLVLIRV